MSKVKYYCSFNQCPLSEEVSANSDVICRMEKTNRDMFDNAKILAIHSNPF